jgi:hypothetical protein
MRTASAVLACGLLAALPSGAAAAAHSRVPAACRGFARLVNGQPHSIAARGIIPPGRLLESFALLRRPQTATDRLPSGHSLGRQVNAMLAVYDPSLTRRVGTIFGDPVYLVVGVGRTLSPPDRCRPHLTAPERILFDFLDSEVGSGPGYCFVAVGARDALGVNTFCADLLDVPDGFAEGALEPSFGGPSAEIGLVPDGFSVVTETFPAPTRPASFAVTDNVFTGPAAASPTAAPHDLHSPRAWRKLLDLVTPTRVTWVTGPGTPGSLNFPRPRRLVSRLAAFFVAETEIGPEVVFR